MGPLSDCRKEKVLDLPGKPFIHIILIAVLGGIVYSNTFNVPFQFDDSVYIYENPIIKNLAYFAEPALAKNIQVVDGHHTLIMRYIGALSFALNYKLHGLDVTGYHIVNTSIHIINAMLVYWLVVLLFKAFAPEAPAGRPLWTALVSALLFVSHPAQTQAVTYISQRFTSLMTLFYLVSVVLYIKWRISSQSEGGGTASASWYLASLVAAVLSMKTKENAFTLPAIIAICEFSFFRGKTGKRLLCLFPFLLTLLIIPAGLMHTGSADAHLLSALDKATRTDTDVTRPDYLFTQFRVIVTYIRLLFIPANQNLDYDYPVYHSFFRPEVYLSFFFLVSLLGLGGYLFYRSAVRGAERGLRFIAFGIFWSFMTMAVESSLIPQLDLIFEHRLYLPSIGFFTGTATAVFIIGNAGVRNPLQKKAAFVSLFAAVLVLSWATYSRNSVWQDEALLWQDVTVKSPGKARPHNILGVCYKKQGRLNEAVDEFRSAIRLNPAYPNAHYNLGTVYMMQGRPEEAIDEFRSAIRLNPVSLKTYRPVYIEAHQGLGVVYTQLGRLDEAIDEFRTAIGFDPEYPEAHYNLGVAYIKQERPEEAVGEFKTALRLDPMNLEAHNNLGVAYRKQGRLNEAVDEFQKVLSLNPAHSNARFNLEIAYSMLNDRHGNQVK